MQLGHIYIHSFINEWIFAFSKIDIVYTEFSNYLNWHNQFLFLVSNSNQSFINMAESRTQVFSLKVLLFHQFC